MKSKPVYLVWCLFFGWMGAHKYYLGYNSAVLYTLFFWTGIPLLVSFYDFLDGLFNSESTLNSCVQKHKVKQEADMAAYKEQRDFKQKNKKGGEDLIEPLKAFNIELEKSETMKPHLIFVDIETTDKPKNYNGDISDIDNWPQIVSIAWIVTDYEVGQIKEEYHFVKPTIHISPEAISKHGITEQMALDKGIEWKEALDLFLNDAVSCKYIVAHNIDFDIPIIQSNALRIGYKKPLTRLKKICTMKKGVKFADIRFLDSSKRKWPTLLELASECYHKYDLSKIEVHNALTDAKLTAHCSVHLNVLGYINIEEPSE